MKTTARRCLAAVAFAAALLFATAASAEDFDWKPAGKPTRENLPNGGYVEIYKNKKGERVAEETHDALGRKTSEKRIKGYHPNGKEFVVEVSHYGVDAKGNEVLTKLEVYHYDNKGGTTIHYDYVYEHDANGKLTKTTTTQYDAQTGQAVDREITDWVTNEKTHKVRDSEKKKWKTVKPVKKENREERGGDMSFEQPAEAAVFFRAGEVQLRAFAVLAVGNAQETDSRTVHETRMVVRDRKVQKTVLEDIPGQPGLTLVTKEIVEPTAVRESVAHREDTTVGPYGDHAFGFGMDAKYFLCRNMGLGVEGDWLSAEHDAWSVFATVTARWPIEGRCHVAPYAAAGIGGQFADDSRLVGMVAAGVEKRFSPRCGTFVEGRYLFDGNKENVFELRVGVSLVFGHSDETAGENISVPHRGGGGAERSVSWGQIDPLAKELRP